MDKICGNCKKWKHNVGNMGECRAKAPQPVVFKGVPTKQYTTVWPPMSNTDFCHDDFEPAMRTV